MCNMLECGQYHEKLNHNCGIESVTIQQTADLVDQEYNGG